MEEHSLKNKAAGLWEQAFASLSDNDKHDLHITPDDVADGFTLILSTVKAKRDDCVKKQWALYTNKAGEKVLVRDIMNKVSDWMNHFKAVVDIAVQYDPGHAALPWAAVRLLLQASVNDCQTFGAMLESIEPVSSIVARYAELESRVLIRTSVLTKQLSVALTQLYVAVLQFLAQARRYFADSTLKRALKSSIKSSKTVVDTPMLSIEKREGEVYKLVSLVQNECAGRQLEDMLEMMKQSIDNVRSSNEQRRKRISASINGIDTRNTYETVLGYHHNGTCDWTLCLKEYKTWHSNDTLSSAVLWIHGPAGFGKTFISAWIIRHLEQLRQQPPAFFFCVADNQATRDPYAILRSWLTQILEQDDVALQAMSSQLTMGDKEQTLTHSELWELFIAVGDAVPGYIFVVDGFDECIDIDGGARYHRNDPRNRFLRDMIKSLSQTRSRVLVVSRDVQDIREVIGKSFMIGSPVKAFEYQITAGDTAADVQSFSEFIVNERLPKKKEGLKQKIADQAAERSQGMFLWIKLLENEISPGQNAKELMTTVKEMPLGISEAYCRELEKIAQLPEKQKKAALMVLRWVLYSVRPLLVKELAEAIVVSDDDLEEYPDEDMFPDAWQDSFVDDDYVHEMILGRCGSLLQLRSKSADTPLSDHTVHIVHFSVKEYITSLQGAADSDPLSSTLGLTNGVTEEARLTNICLRYLTLGIFEEIPSDISAYPLLSYASWAWYFHSFHKKLIPPPQDIMQRTQKAFDPMTRTWKVWTPVMETEVLDYERGSQALDKSQPSAQSDLVSNSDSEDADESESSATVVEETHLSLTNVQNPIYYASLLGLVDVVKWLEDHGLDCNCTGGRFGFPLQAAVVRSQNAVVKYLLDGKANASLEGGIYGSAVNAAAALSTLEIVDLLLAAGASITTTDDDNWTALHYATQRGSPEIARRLLDYGAEVDAQTKLGNTALHIACRFGYKGMAELLLSRGANVASANNDCKIPFQDALDLGHEDIAIVLLDYIPVDDTQLLNDVRFLHTAITAGSSSAIKKLLEKCVGLNSKDERGWTALQVAASMEDADIVELLVHAGADISCSQLTSPTPITIAAANNRNLIIKLLHKHGVDVNQPSSEGHTALSWAAASGYKDTVELLLELNASLRHLYESTQDSLLDIALENIDKDLSLLLVTHGCFRSLKGIDTAKSQKTGEEASEYREKLLALAYEGKHAEILPSIQNASGSLRLDDLNEALFMASARGHEIIVRLLLRKCTINTQDLNGRTALHYALRHLHESVADLLIENGANILIEDDIGSTPLDLAILHGMKATAFIKKHMGDLTIGINRRPSLLVAAGKRSDSLSSHALRKMISGHWEGHYDYLTWQRGRTDPFSITIPDCDPDNPLQTTFSSEREHDDVGDFHYHGFVDAIGVIWIVKLYRKQGWLYRGQFNVETRTMKGTWGSNRKLWFGTFRLQLTANAE